MIKILAIGNSFSQDATAYIELLTDKLFVRNLYIGGCSLEKHCALLNGEQKAYEYQHNGEKCLPELVSVKQALTMENWDFITVQQVSGLSGIESSYYPYLPQLIAYIKQYSNAKIIFHQTWAYEKDSTHQDFAFYDNKQDTMHQALTSVALSVCKREGLDYIPTGEVIDSLREYPFFDVDCGGLSLCRDGFHLSMNYGRFAAACVWSCYFLDELPAYLQRNDLSHGYQIIKKMLLAK